MGPRYHQETEDSESMGQILAAVAFAVFLAQAGRAADIPERANSCFCSYDHKTEKEISYCKQKPPAKLKGLESWRCDPVNLYPLNLKPLLLVDQGTGLRSKVRVTTIDDWAVIVKLGNEPEKIYDTSRMLQWGSSTQVTESSNSQGMATGMTIGGLLLGFPGMLMGGAIGGAPRYDVNETISFLYLHPDGSREVITLVNPQETPSSYYYRFQDMMTSGTGLKPGLFISEEKFLEKRKARDTKVKQEIASLSVQKEGRPWCLEKPTDPAKLMRYTALSKLTESSKPIENDEEAWLSYLNTNPGFKAWTEAHPQQARLLQSCRG